MRIMLLSMLTVSALARVNPFGIYNTSATSALNKDEGALSWWGYWSRPSLSLEGRARRLPHTLSCPRHRGATKGRSPLTQCRLTLTQSHNHQEKGVEGGAQREHLW